jgi:uncharacterized protein (DUF1778 family)
MTDTELAYLELPADARLEVRVPAVLKQHAEMVASARQENLSEFVLAVLAQAVAERLAEVGTWKLTMPEQEELLRILTQPAVQTPAMTAARERAEKLFGPAVLERIE